MKLFSTFALLSVVFLSSCDGMPNTPKWAFEWAEQKVRDLYYVSDVETYEDSTVIKNSSTFTVYIDHYSRSNAGSYRWYLDVCTVPFDTQSVYSVSCY